MAKQQAHFQGFTLAELLICLAILGEIATFTIPKVLYSQGISRNTAILKETAGMIEGAYQAYQQSNTVTASTNILALTPYMNYVSVTTAGSVDDQGAGSYNCNTNSGCLKLHNGAAIYLGTDYFGGTQPNNTMHICVDPDGVKDANTINDPGAAVCFLLYYNGALTTRNNARSGSVAGCCGSFGPGGGYDPSWFSW
jgi:prepilin-type N-terminal cleavage/methylation domain-containing protein